MAVLIPSLSSCVSRMTSGEKRLAERLEQKLEDDYLLWYDVPMGPRNMHPDFCVLHPRRGILVLEVKDWRLSTILQADKQNWEIISDGVPRTVINPLELRRDAYTTIQISQGGRHRDEHSHSFKRQERCRRGKNLNCNGSKWQSVVNKK